MSIQLKIFFSTTGLTKTMRFTQTMSVSETLKDIKDKTGEGGRDHGTLITLSLATTFKALLPYFLCSSVYIGLYQPGDEKIGRNGRWLKPDKTLLFYDIKSGVCLLNQMELLQTTGQCCVRVVNRFSLFL